MRLLMCLSVFMCSVMNVQGSFSTQKKQNGPVSVLSPRPVNFTYPTVPSITDFTQFDHPTNPPTPPVKKTVCAAMAGNKLHGTHIPFPERILRAVLVRAMTSVNSLDELGSPKSKTQTPGDDCGTTPPTPVKPEKS